MKMYSKILYISAVLAKLGDGIRIFEFVYKM